MAEVTLNLPGRDQKIEEYKQYLRNLARPASTTRPMPTWATASGVRRPRRPAAAPPPAPSTGQTAKGTGPARIQGPLTHGRVYTERRDLGQLHVLHQQVVPVAEELGVRIGIHPDDPPVPILGGVPRCIFGNFDGYKRALEIANSPNVGVCLCCGTWLEGGENEAKTSSKPSGISPRWASSGRSISATSARRSRISSKLRGQRLHGHVEDHAGAARSRLPRRRDRRSRPRNGRAAESRLGLQHRLHQGAPSPAPTPRCTRMAPISNFKFQISNLKFLINFALLHHRHASVCSPIRRKFFPASHNPTGNHGNPLLSPERIPRP